MSIERGPVKHPRIRSFAYPKAHPFRVCVMWTSPNTATAAESKRGAVPPGMAAEAKRHALETVRRSGFRIRP